MGSKDIPFGKRESENCRGGEGASCVVSSFLPEEIRRESLFLRRSGESKREAVVVSRLTARIRHISDAGRATRSWSLWLKLRCDGMVKANQDAFALRVA